MNTETTKSILSAAIDLYRAQGFNGTSIKQIVSASSATTGSVYHFFPRGKDQLTIEAIKLSGPSYQSLIEQILDEAEDLPSGIYAVCEQAAEHLAESNYLDLCPIGGVAREIANTKPEIRKAIAGIFSSWRKAIEARLVDAGIAESVAIDIATSFIAAIEGGFTIARTHRNPETLLSIGRVAKATVELELAKS